jgi:choline dehydrogenase-like flavoprotein
MAGPAVNRAAVSGPETHRDVIVVGSGFGGAMVAWPLVHAGVDVLMLERGSQVARGPHNWEDDGTIMRSAAYTTGPSYVAETEGGSAIRHAYACVGGPSVYYGGVSLRFRVGDFDPGPEIVTDSGARWPFGYETLSPYYDRAERILGVTGIAGDDPTGPPRQTEYPAPPGALSEVSRAIARAAEKRGLTPFRLPLAINYGTAKDDARPSCLNCDTCDTFPCAIEAKNDIAVQVLRVLIRQGLELRAQVAVTEILMEGDRAVGVAYLDKTSGERVTVTANRVVLAGGALGSAQLLLASGLEEVNPAGDLVGRYLTRHCSGITFGAYSWLARYEGRFHKQIGINDYYFGDPSGRGPSGPLGNIQQTQTPKLGTVKGELNGVVASLLAPVVRRITGLLMIAEDRPQYRNRVMLDSPGTQTPYQPSLRVEHHYADRDREARRFLGREASKVHRAAGSLGTYTHLIDTFSHALGTVRMGEDPVTAPLDAQGRFRGVKGLYVSDGSALPTAAGVNPSLTISANALRVGDIIVEDLRMTGRSA